MERKIHTVCSLGFSWLSCVEFPWQGRNLSFELTGGLRGKRRHSFDYCCFPWLRITSRHKEIISVKIKVTISGKEGTHPPPGLKSKLVKSWNTVCPKRLSQWPRVWQSLWLSLTGRCPLQHHLFLFNLKLFFTRATLYTCVLPSCLFMYSMCCWCSKSHKRAQIPWNWS